MRKNEITKKLREIAAELLLADTSPSLCAFRIHGLVSEIEMDGFEPIAVVPKPEPFDAKEVKTKFGL